MKDFAKAVFKKRIFLKFRIDSVVRCLVRMFRVKGWFMMCPPYDGKIQNLVTSSIDPIRHGTIALAINAVKKNNIKGDFAEVGVYKGETSRLIHAVAKKRKLYLFDTFEGFSHKDLEYRDERFRDTSIVKVKKKIGDINNIIIKKGYFPKTTEGLEDRKFAFVMLDIDLGKPTLAGLKFFYPRMSSGGYIFVHDYNSPESDWAVFNAVNEFMKDKPEKIIEIPDMWGSVVIRKF